MEGRQYYIEGQEGTFLSVDHHTELLPQFKDKSLFSTIPFHNDLQSGLRALSAEGTSI